MKKKVHKIIAVTVLNDVNHDHWGKMRILLKGSKEAQGII